MAQPPHLSAIPALLLAAGPALAARTKVVTVLGDSITAGYGLPASEAQPLYVRDKVALTTQEREALRASAVAAA